MAVYFGVYKEEGFLLKIDHSGQIMIFEDQESAQDMIDRLRDPDVKMIEVQVQETEEHRMERTKVCY